MNQLIVWKKNTNPAMRIRLSYRSRIEITNDFINDRYCDERGKLHYAFWKRIPPSKISGSYYSVQLGNG